MSSIIVIQKIYTSIFITTITTDVQCSMEHSLRKPLAKTIMYSQLVDECVTWYRMKKCTLVQIDDINCFLLIREPDVRTEIVS